MKTHCKLLATAAAFILLTIGPALAQTDPHTGQSGQHGQTGSASRMTPDSNFVTKAALGSMAEVELGRLASQRASNDSVKNFGQRMVTDHTKAGDELKQVASGKGMDLPTSLDAKHHATMDRLSKLNGADFDRAYMADMVKDHREDVTEFRRESQRGTDPDVKAFAAKTLPTLEEHLKLAESIQAQVKK